MGGTCWDEYQVCPCCYYELFNDQDAYEPGKHRRCTNAIIIELGAAV